VPGAYLARRAQVRSLVEGVSPSGTTGGRRCLVLPSSPVGEHGWHRRRVSIGGLVEAGNRTKVEVGGHRLWLQPHGFQSLVVREKGA
jgi:hypothetical protein